MRVAILLTCYNRVDHTRQCLLSLQKAMARIGDVVFDIYLVDDGSTDSTASAAKEIFPHIQIVRGTGHLFWAGGMRMAWNTALLSTIAYNGFLLINDDVVFFPDFWEKISKTIDFVSQSNKKGGVYVLSTQHKETKQLSYGGYLLRNRLFKHSYYRVTPDEIIPKACHLTNANILFVANDVYRELGVLDDRFTHSLADFDYALSAHEKGFPVLVCPSYGGYCTNDHSRKPLAKNATLSERIHYLYSIKGLALNEYLYYLNKHFRWKAPYAFVVFWIKTLFKTC